MSPVTSILLVAFVSPPLPRELEEQREFEATLVDDEGYYQVERFVEDNHYFYFSSRFVELAASAAQSDVDEVALKGVGILSRIGSQAAEYDRVIIPLLEHDDPAIRIAAIYCLGEMHPGRFYPQIARMAVFDENDRPFQEYSLDSVHSVAVEVLARSESLEAAPYLLAVYLDEDPQRAAEAIRQTANCSPELQQALIPGLIQALRRDDSALEAMSSDVFYEKPLREDVIDVLGGMRELAAPYIAEIEQGQFHEDDPELRIRYAAAILSIGGHDDEQIELLRSALLDFNERAMVHRSCRVCSELPWVAELLSEELLALMESDDPWFRESAAEAVRATEMNTPEVIAALNQLAVDYSEDTWTCWTAMQALAERGELADPLEAVLQAMEASGDYEADAYEALNVLQLVSDDAVILEQIEAAFADADVDRQNALIYLLDWIGADAAVFERLLELPLLDEQRELLEMHYENALVPYVPVRITDWRLPDANESAP